ncbi:phosphatidate cytidylyltransferase [Telluria sp. Tellsp131]
MSIVRAMTALYGLLAVASLSVKFAARGAAPGMLSYQVNAWWRIFPIVSLALVTYPTGLHVLAYLICAFATLELESYYPGGRTRFRLGAAMIVLVTGILNSWMPVLAAALLCGAISVLSMRCRQIGTAGPAITWSSIVATAAAMQLLVAFASLPFTTRTNLAWLFYLFILTALNDIGQFVAGKLFGRHKIAPTISPNKTWQGLAGGVVMSQIVSLVLGTYLSLATPSQLALWGLLLSLAGFAGDLMFSAAKRCLSIKDFSQLIPGHGGILDRVDSLVLTAPLLYCLLRSID